MKLFQIVTWGTEEDNDVTWFLLGEEKEDILKWAELQSIHVDQLWDMGETQLPQHRRDLWGIGVETVCGPLTGCVYNTQHIESWDCEEGQPQRIESK